MNRLAAAASVTLGLLLSPQAHAIPVYQTPDALFSTADVHPRLLTPDGSMVMKSWLRVSEGWLPRSSGFRDIDLSEKGILKTDTAIRAKPDGALAPQAVLRAATRVAIIGREESWIKIKTETSVGWVLEETLNPDPFDRGSIFTKKITRLRMVPNSLAKFGGTVSAGVKLKPLAVHNSWILVKYQGAPGWLTFDDVFSRMDFALRILPRNENGWRLVMEDKSKGHQYKPMGPWFRVGLKEWFALNQIRGLQTDPRKIIIVTREADARTLPSRSRSRIVAKHKFGDAIPFGQPTMITWLHMNSREGSIWWPLYPAGSANQDGNTKDARLTTAQLFSRKIFDISESPLKSHFKIASSQGIYKTYDDKTWEKIKFFGSKNYPVAISPKGDLYVGGYRSHDFGKSFSAYLRWDRVLARISRHQTLAPQKLRLTKIEFPENRPDILITVNAGTHPLGAPASSNNFILSSPDGGLHWNYVSEKMRRRFDFAHGLSMNDE